MEFVYVLLFALVLFLWPIGLVTPRKSLFQNLSLAINGICLSVIIYSLVAIFNLNFNLLSKIIFTVQALIFSKGLLTFFIHIQYSLHKQKLNLIFIFTSILVVKNLSLLLIRPILDPDVVNSYLPFAQSTYLSNKIPTEELLTHQPITTPPVGGWILFSVAMSLTENSHTEIFKLLPFFFHSLLLLSIFEFSLKSQGKEMAICVSLIYLLLPFSDEFIMTYALYPELFFSLLFFFSFRKIISQKLSNADYLQIGLFLSTATLLKFQGLFFYPIFLIFVFIYFYKNTIIPLLTILFLTYISLNPLFFSSAGFSFPNTKTLVLIVSTLLVFSWLVVTSIHKKKFVNLKFAIIVTALSVITGSSWGIRTYKIFHNPFSDSRVDTKSVYMNQNDINHQIVSFSTNRNSGISPLLLLNSFGTLFLIPKLFGLVNVFKLDQTKALLFISTLWVFVWIAFMGSIAPGRYLVPLIPIIVITSAHGTQFFSKKFKISPYVIIILLGLSSLSQSTFLSWNSAVNLLGYKITKEISSSAENSQNFERNLSIKNTFLKYGAILNLSEDKVAARWFDIVTLSCLFFTISIIGARLLRNKNLNSFQNIVLISFIFLAPYVFVVYNVSDGHISKFAQSEKTKIYNYWGLTNHIIPLLKRKVSPDSKVIIFSPLVPLSHESDLASRNIDSGFGIKDLTPILNETNLDNVYSFLRKEKYNVFLLDAHAERLERYSMLKKLNPSMSIFQNPKYFTKISEPNDSSNWFLYIIKEPPEI